MNRIADSLRLCGQPSPLFLTHNTTDLIGVLSICVYLYISSERNASSFVNTKQMFLLLTMVICLLFEDTTTPSDSMIISHAFAVHTHLEHRPIRLKRTKNEICWLSETVQTIIHERKATEC